MSDRPTKRMKPSVDVRTREEAPQDRLRHQQAEEAAEIVRRRLAGDIYAQQRPPIQFKERGLVARWVNSAVSVDRIWRARTQQGWLPVTPEMLADPSQLGSLVTNQQGHVVRGERGQEVLMYMPQTLYDTIQRKKAADNDRRIGLGSPQRARQHVAEHLNRLDQTRGAEFVEQALRGEVIDSREPHQFLEDPRDGQDDTGPGDGEQETG